MPARPRRARRRVLRTPDDEATRVWRAWEALHDGLPSLLFHYTTADGLLGMLKGRELWATHVRFMNDTSEMAYGIDLVRGELEAHSRRMANETPALARRFRDYARTVVRILDDSATYTKHYLICFCTQGNLLSQWRGYGAVGGGFAVGFQTKALGRFAAEFLPTSPVPREQLPVFLRRVIYDPAVQRSIVRRCLDGLTREAASYRAHPAQKAPKDGFSLALARALYECLVCFKHPGFSEEQEWRLIQQGRVADTDVCREDFRARAGRIVSFTTLRYEPATGRRRARATSGRPFPISTITYGPTLDPEASERALRLLLASHGFRAGQVAIEASGIPFKP